MAILVADVSRTLGAAPQLYLLDEEDTVNVSIANNNNGAAVTVIATFARASGSTDPRTISIPAYAPLTLTGVRMKALILSGNGANVTVIITSGQEVIRVEPLTIGQRVSPVASDPRYLALYENRYFATLLFAVSPAAATQRVLVRLLNPVGSGVNLIITLIRVVCNTARGFWIATNNPTGGLANTMARINKAAAGSGLSVSKGLPSNNNNLTADVANPLHHETLIANTMTEYREPLLIKPTSGSGTPPVGAMDIQVGDVADATTDIITIQLEWFEESVL